MAESPVEARDEGERNFILAKLLSLFGDTVEFDVVNIVAQENDWNEEKCIELLKVLGDYKNPDTTSFTRDVIETLTLDNETIPLPRDNTAKVAQQKKSGYSDVTSKVTKSKVAGHRQGNAQTGVAGTKMHSPSKAPGQRPKERSSESQEHHDQVKALIESGTPILIILRGLPGSGKSTLAKSLLAQPGAKGGCSHSADDFFLFPRGRGSTEYRFDPLRLGEAHEWNQTQVLRAIAHGVSPIIVDNTNVQKWEMLPYVKMALEPWKAETILRRKAANGSIPKNNICSSLGPARMAFQGKKCSCGYTVMETSKVPYRVELLEPLTWWYQHPARLAKVNQHGVTQKKITQMLSHFEFGLTGKDLVQCIQKKEVNSNPNSSNPHDRKSVQQANSSMGGSSLYCINSKRNQGNNSGMRPRHITSQNLPGNNAAKQNSMNHLQNYAGFSSGPLPPLLTFPHRSQEVGVNFNPFYTSASSNSRTFNNSVGKDSLSNFWAPKDQLYAKRKEELNSLLHSHQSPFSKSASNLSSPFVGCSFSSGPESKQKDKERRSSSSNVSLTNNSDKLSSSPQKTFETSSYAESEGVEMSEEELKEWMETNSSRWEWESSDENSENESNADCNQPKPPRPLKRRNRDSSIQKSESRGGEDKSAEYEAEEENVPEWVTEEFDPLISWNEGKNNSDDGEDKMLVPLPPRESRHKKMVENSAKFENDDKPCDDVDQVQIGIIKQIQSLLGELGVRNKELEPSMTSSENATNEIQPLSSTVNIDLTPQNVVLKLSNESDSEGCTKVLPKLESLVSETIISSGTANECVKDVKDESFNVISTVSELQVENFQNANTFAADSVTHTRDSETISKDIHENNEKVCVEKIEDPLLAAFKSVLSNSPDISTIQNPSADETNPEKDVGSCLKESDIITMSVENKEKIIECEKNNQKTTSSFFGEGLKRFDDAFQKNKSDFEIVPMYETKEEKSQPLLLGKCIDELKDLEKQCNTSQLSIKVKDDEQEKTKLCAVEKPLLKLQKIDVELMENVGTSLSTKTVIEQNDNTKDAFQAGDATLIDFPESMEGRLGDSPPEGISSSLVELDWENISFKQNGKLSTLEMDKNHASLHLENNESVLEKRNEVDILIDLSVPSLESDFSQGLSVLGNLQSNFEVNDISEDHKILTPEILAPKLPCTDDDAGVVTGGEVQQSTLNDMKINAIQSPCSSEVIKEIITDKTEKIPETELENTEKKVGLQTFQDTFENKMESPSLNSSRGENEPCTTTSNAAQDSKKIGIVKDLNMSFSIEEEENEESITDWSIRTTDSDSTMDLDDDKETIPLVLDHNFVEQICQRFGNLYQESLDESFRVPSGQGSNHSGITVQVPVYLARKLHQCWLKTQWNAILEEEEMSQKMIQEDELLARWLQECEKEDLKEQNNKSESSSATPNLREIMDMEMAMAIYKADQDKESQLNNRSDMSTRLSWDLLTKEFPQIPQDVITQIFSAYNFSYNNSREALLSSLPDFERNAHESVKDVISPEAIVAQEKALIEKAKLESLKFQNSHLEEDEEDVEGEVEGDWETLVDQARKAASLNRRLQKERHAQAQAAGRSGIPSAAAYYCRMASLHKQKVEEANRKAASILSRVFTGDYKNLKDSRGENEEVSRPPSTLDMHSMSVLEALRVMNAFLDAHAEWLRTRKSSANSGAAFRKSSPVKMATLFLITGRGVNSQGGIPRIKPAVERLLEKRGIWYEELNPGLLRVMVSANLAPAKKM